SGNAFGNRAMERPATGSVAVHRVRRVLSRDASSGPVAVSLLWPAYDWARYAGVAHGANRCGVELCRVRVPGLPRCTGSHSSRTVGSVLPFGHESFAGVPENYFAAGVSHRVAANDE